MKDNFLENLDKTLEELRAERERLIQLAATLETRNYMEDIVDIIKSTYRQLGKTDKF